MTAECPNNIGGAKVLWFTRVEPQPRSPITGLAIVRSGSACYLFSCDREWGCVFDSWHPSVESAKKQAASQYSGAMNWVGMGVPAAAGSGRATFP